MPRFDSRSMHITDEIAKSCLEAASAVYEDSSGAIFSHTDHGCKFCIPVAETTVMVAFRGTTNLENLRTDLQIAQVPYRDGRSGRVHQGFFEAYEALEPVLVGFLQDHPGKIVRFVGHSLGGALATLAAFHFAAGAFDVECITFGCPKVGDEDFCRSYRERVPKTTRFINKFDPVPRLLHGAESSITGVRNDADVFHMILGKILKFPQQHLAGGQYAHVCEAIQLDAGRTGAIASANHWGSAMSSLVWLSGGHSDDKQMKVWRQELVPHDVSVYRQNLEKKPSFQLGSLKELKFLLGIIRACPSEVLVAAALATALALLWWRAQEKTTASPEWRSLEKELQSAAQKKAVHLKDLPARCHQLLSKLELEIEDSNKKELSQELEVLCQATFAAVQLTEGEGADFLEPWRCLAPLLGRFLWKHTTSPGQWMELVPSAHLFQDLALEIEGEAAIAWAPDSWEVRVTLAFTERLVRKDPLSAAVAEWFRRFAELVPESELPSCTAALDYDSAEPYDRLIAVKTLVVFLCSFASCWPCALSLAIHQRIQCLTTDAHRDVKQAAAESLKEVNDLLGLEPLLLCTQHQDSNVRRDAIQLLKDLWERSDNGPCWIMQELQRIGGSAAEEARFYLQQHWPDVVELLEVELSAQKHLQESSQELDGSAAEEARFLESECSDVVEFLEVKQSTCKEISLASPRSASDSSEWSLID